MAIVSNLSSTSANVVVQLDNNTIRPMAASARDEMALVSNCTTASADVEVQSETSTIRPMAASARGKMVGARGELLGARGELLGARGGCGPDLYCSQWRLWLLEVFGARSGCSTYGLYLGFNYRLCYFKLRSERMPKKIPHTGDILADLRCRMDSVVW